MATVHTDHVGVLVVAEVVHLLGFLIPWVPDDGVGKVVFLDPHLPARHHVGHDVLVWCVDVDPAGQSAVRKSKSKKIKGKKERLIYMIVKSSVW